MTARRGRRPTASGFTGVNCGAGVSTLGRRIVIFLISLGEKFASNCGYDNWNIININPRKICG